MPGSIAAGRAGGFGFGGGASFSDIFGDVFGDIFGGGGGAARRSGPQRGADLRYNLEIDLEEAVHGTTVKIRVPTLVTCDDCDGSGAKARQHAGELYDLRRCRPGAHAAGLLLGAADLPALPRQGQDDQAIPAAAATATAASRSRRRCR